MEKRGRPKKREPTLAENLLSSTRNIEYQTEELHKIRQLLEIQTKAIVFLVQSQNTNFQACDKFREYLDKELKETVLDFPFKWGEGKKWN